jgi:hypothetical protein
MYVILYKHWGKVVDACTWDRKVMLTFANATMRVLKLHSSKSKQLQRAKRDKTVYILETDYDGPNDNNISVNNDPEEIPLTNENNPEIMTILDDNDPEIITISDDSLQEIITISDTSMPEIIILSDSESDDDSQHSVQAILAHKRKGYDYMYKIKWFGYEEVSWEPENNLNCTELLIAYNMKHNIN